MRHVLPVRVYFEDTDFSGLVYHGSYVRWCERGRSDFLRLLGNSHRDLEEGAGEREPAAFVVRRMQLDFLKPAHIDDVLNIRTQVKEVGAATLTLDQRMSGRRPPVRGRGHRRAGQRVGQAAAPFCRPDRDALSRT